MPNSLTEWSRYGWTWLVVAGVVLLVTGWLARRVRWPAKIRIAFVFMSFGVALLPGFAPWIPPVEFAGSVSSGAVAPVPPQTTGKTISQGEGNVTDIPSPAIQPAASLDLTPIGLMLLGLWPLGFLVGSVATVRAVVHMNRIVQNASHDGSLRRSDAVTGPAVVGWPKSVVLVQAAWPEPFTESESAAVLAHEEAHRRGKHLDIALACEVLARWFWWAPGVRNLTLALDSALEDLADRRVVDCPARAHALASALVKAAEQSVGPLPRFCPQITPRSGLEDRVRRLLEGEIMNRRSFVSGLVGLLVLGGTGMAVAVITASTQPEDFGLIPGSVWEYTITGKEGPEPFVQRAEKVVMVKGKPVVELTQKFGKYKPNYHYLAVDAEGFWMYHNSQMSGPGVAEDVAPEPMWKLPLKQGSQWTWISPFRGQISSNGQDINMADLDSKCTGKVVATNVEVTVPAGTFRTTHVQINRASKGMGGSQSDYWIAPGIGIVKEVDRWLGEQPRTSERLLTKFTVGKR